LLARSWWVERCELEERVVKWMVKVVEERERSYG
jgi:hypothetical protein